ncbi:MAG: CBS domain-containing protein [Acidobacteriota bacterium]
MFSVIGVNGDVFRGSLEHLLATHRVPSLRRQRGIEQDGHDPPTAGRVPAPPDDQRYQAAAAAYAAAAEPEPPERGPVYHAYQVMTRQVLTVTSATRVDAAWRALVTRGVGQAPVLNSSGRLVGLVSREHLLHVLNEEDGRVSEVLARTVADVMETPVVTAAPVSDVRRVALVMLEYRLPALPVVDEQSNALVGIVSRGDLLRCIVTDPPLTMWA